MTSWTDLSVSTYGVLALRSDGTIWEWGFEQSSPVQVGASVEWSQVSRGPTHCLGIQTDGTLWSWPLGTSPAQVGVSTNWSKIEARHDYSLAIKTDGTLWAWGQNGSGQLGLTLPIADRSSPVQIGSLTNWSMAVAGSECSIAIKTDGTLWAWGGTTGPVLGLGDQSSRSSPVQVGTSTNWIDISVWGHALGRRK